MHKKLFILFTCILAIFSTNPFIVYADVLESNEELTALKVAIKDENNVGEYEIKINVPGKEVVTSEGYNILFVTDASYSMDRAAKGESLTKWQKMRNSIIEIANELLPNDDASKNFNKLGLITFGIDSHIVIPFTSDKEEFFDSMPLYSTQSLLPGRSSTNNEVGLLGAREYLESLNIKDPEHTYVIYITDGESNMNEEEEYWYNNLISGAKYGNTVILELNYSYLAETLITLEANKNNSNISYLSLFDDTMEEIRNLYSKETGSDSSNVSINTILQEISIDNSELTNIFDNCINSLYKYIGYDFETSYSSGKFERMFSNVNFVSDNINLFEGTEYYNSIEESARENLLEHIQDMFYYLLLTKSFPSNVNASRAVNEGNKLKEYATIYTIAYNTSNSLTRDDAKKIMDPNYEGNGSSYSSNIGNHFSSGYYFSNIEDISTSLISLTQKITYTMYSNVKVIDYTSKWVIPMDINNDGVFDENDITVKNNGININANVEVLELTDETIASLSNEEQIQINNDIELVNNSNNKIYKITWYISEDLLHSYDQYELSYRVKVDTGEKDFISEKEYKANGITTLFYDKNIIDDNGDYSEVIPNQYDINVPVVSQKENIVIIIKKDENDNLLEGSDFDIISNDNTENIIKEYSKDGINYSLNNDNASYFRFSGLYDYTYSFAETKVAEYYNGFDGMTIDFTNTEGSIINETVVNLPITGKVIINYVIKVADKYIPLNDYAKDDEGNVLSGFENIDLEDIILSGKINEEFKTIFKNIENYTFNGIYKNSINSNNKLNGTSITGKFTEDIQKYIYVYEISTGIGGNTPPKTGIIYQTTYRDYLTILLGLLLVIKKIIK